VSVVEVHHVLEGRSEPDAPVLLLICPLGATLEVWEPILPELLRYFRVLRYDQRGHGRSPVSAGPYSVETLAHDAIALLDRLRITSANVCGTSLGGMVGLWLAARAKARVDKLAVLCSSARLEPAEAFRERAALVRAQGCGAIAKAAVARWFTPEFAARSSELVARMEQMVASTPAEGYAACCEAIATWDHRGSLAAIEAPTWVLAGERDSATPPAHAYALGALIPNVRVTVLESTAHLALAERPERIARLLLDHFGPARSAGEEVRRAVLGDAHVDRAQAATSEFDAPFQELITRYAWGEIWARPGLTRAERSIATLSVLAALHHDDELAMHLRAALRNGLTREQIREILLQLAIYAGVPAANRAFRIAREVLA
jgi:3-oxoadipate enol-lactonase/4-carboxymuconolactone decarboxylase